MLKHLPQIYGASLIKTVKLTSFRKLWKRSSSPLASAAILSSPKRPFVLLQLNGKKIAFYTGVKIGSNLVPEFFLSTQNGGEGPVAKRRSRVTFNCVRNLNSTRRKARY